ncbi:uncharacterized protein F5Z01DRAFT_633548 [Emericellopsis atlantica]|uniref:Uncharacterized protein n=1 Tax=Emericellopsis atlantica TaxID=2614577 RepID=A0A9P7ZTR9_9HYPO|nr:uncharacterized protein F5Z01DRAFT_633548 [Emericellopsis atlantica]KAG9257627.1 hypothetical protein F5Z01DRAFT_633548 [Emericellopsis atlantica]
MDSLVGRMAGAQGPAPIHLGANPLSFAPLVGPVTPAFDPVPCAQLLDLANEDDKFRSGFVERLQDIHATELDDYLALAHQHHEEYVDKLGLKTVEKLGGLSSFLCEEVVYMHDNLWDKIENRERDIHSLRDKNRQLEMDIKTVQGSVPIAPSPLSRELHDAPKDFLGNLTDVTDVEKSALTKLTAAIFPHLNDFTLVEATTVPQLFRYHADHLMDALNLQLEAEVQKLGQRSKNSTGGPVLERRRKSRISVSDAWTLRELRFKHRAQQVLSSLDQASLSAEKPKHQRRTHELCPGACPLFRADDPTRVDACVGPLPPNHAAVTDPIHRVP